MDNLPPGTACDPAAPYNEDAFEEVEVLLSVTYSKSTTIQMPKGWTEKDLYLHAKTQVFMPTESNGKSWTEDSFAVITE